MRQWIRQALTLPLDAVRSRSERVVYLVPEGGVRIGNILYLLLGAHSTRERKGLTSFVTRTPAIEPWLSAFPALKELVIDRSEMRFRDRRLQRWEQVFTEIGAGLGPFVKECLFAGSERWDEVGERSDDEVTINVRRGDYYSVIEHRRMYGFNIAGYLRMALEGSLRQAPIRSIRVVSDDPQWCRDNLAFMADYGQLVWQQPSDGPVENLVDLGSSRRLILANSTFSYWGGYISSVKYGDNHDLIWAPSFHSRHWGDDVVGWQLDPRWSIVAHPPGGWAEQPQAT